ncbi:KGG domain-containing protein [uncultured Stenotrophomonas sp.]|uniref:KGG domain-containing protein n=1 Tax=uncultured Stenotrophomonas sp. TaxID=165438 RepID=UPI0025E22B9B|nr:KGG domain-containing protein [uncultured Stenotrophomonas sp.]HDS1579603.1 general stress protein [Stenotrophomonas maltophilia]
MPDQTPQRSTRGFASMDEDKQRAIAAKGGRAAHASGNAHEFSPAEARIAGRKGGEAISRNRQHMAAIGREGGHARHANARQQQAQQNEGSAEQHSVEPRQRQQG